MSTDIQSVMDEAEEQQFVMLNFIVPMPIFKMLNRLATERGMTVSGFVSTALQNEVRKIEAKESQGG